jgi:bifunctional DNase/RNase
MVEMSVIGIALDAASRSPIVLLRDPSRRRQVPIWIDQAQAHNIMAGLNGEPSPRPLSHDLMVSLLAAGELHLERVIIHAIEDSTFRAVLKLSHDAPVDEMEDSSEDSREDSADCEPIEEQQTGDDLLNIDARPSDAIALAIRTGSSIWMLEEVVAEASIAVDAEADAEDRNEFRRFLDQVSPAAMVRHLQSRQPKDEETNDDSPLE